MTTEKEPEREREAAEKVEERVEAEEPEERVEAEEKAAEVHAPKAPPQEKKGLMERRESFLQSSVPNAHRGYNPKTPVVMLCIVAFMVVLSFILAAVTF